MSESCVRPTAARTIDAERRSRLCIRLRSSATSTAHGAKLSFMRVAIVHDALCVRGGAERVALWMAKAFPDAPIFTSVYLPDQTFAEYKALDVQTHSLRWAASCARKPSSSCFIRCGCSNFSALISPPLMLCFRHPRTWRNTFVQPRRRAACGLYLCSVQAAVETRGICPRKPAHTRRVGSPGKRHSTAPAEMGSGAHQSDPEHCHNVSAYGG